MSPLPLPPAGPRPARRDGRVGWAGPGGAGLCTSRCASWSPRQAASPTGARRRRGAPGRSQRRGWDQSPVGQTRAPAAPGRGLLRSARCAPCAVPAIPAPPSQCLPRGRVRVSPLRLLRTSRQRRAPHGVLAEAVPSDGAADEALPLPSSPAGDSSRRRSWDRAREARPGLALTGRGQLGCGGGEVAAERWERNEAGPLRSQRGQSQGSGQRGPMASAPSPPTHRSACAPRPRSPCAQPCTARCLRLPPLAASLRTGIGPGAAVLPETGPRLAHWQTATRPCRVGVVGEGERAPLLQEARGPS